MQARIRNLEGKLAGVTVGMTKLASEVVHLRKDSSDIKSDVRQIRDRQERDFRLLFGALITVALGIAALMARGFGWLA